MKKVFFVFCFILFFVNCVYDPPQNSIAVTNNSDSTIFVYWSNSDSITYERQLKLNDTLIDAKTGMITPLTLQYIILPGSVGGLDTIAREGLFELSSDKKLRLFFITKQVMEQRSWADIVKYQLYKDKYTFTLDSLRDIGWDVIYEK